MSTITYLNKRNIFISLASIILIAIVLVNNTAKTNETCLLDKLADAKNDRYAYSMLSECRDLPSVERIVSYDLTESGWVLKNKTFVKKDLSIKKDACIKKYTKNTSSKVAANVIAGACYRLSNKDIKLALPDGDLVEIPNAFNKSLSQIDVYIRENPSNIIPSPYIFVLPNGEEILVEPKNFFHAENKISYNAQRTEKISSAEKDFTEKLEKIIKNAASQRDLLRQ